MRNGCRTKASLIGEYASLDTPGDTELDRNAHRTAGDRLRGKGTPEDHAKYTGNVCYIGKYNHQAGYNVYGSHDGHQLFGNTADALDTTQQYNTYDDCQDNTQYQIDGGDMLCCRGYKLLDGVIDGTGDVTYLYSVANAEGSKPTKDTENHSQPFPVLSQSVSDVVHGAAHPVAVGIALTIFYRQQHLGVLGGHTQQGGNPQPENGACTAQRDSGGNTGNIAGTDCGSQSGGQGLEGGDFSLLGLVLMEHFADGVFHGIAELPELEALEHDRENDTCAHQQHQGGNAPDDAVQPAIAGRYCLINTFHTVLLSFSRCTHACTYRETKNGVPILRRPVK